MNKIRVLSLGTLLALLFVFLAQRPILAAAQAAPAPLGHGAFPVKVVKTLDSSKLKEGDTVELVTSGSFKLPDGTLVPQGSKLTGQVTSAKARSKGDPESQLTLAFDKLNIANGKQLSVKGKVQAVFAPEDEPEPQMAGKATAGAGGSSLGGGDVGTVTNTNPGSNMQTQTRAQSGAGMAATGVQGIHGLELNDGVLTSKGKNVKLSDGVRMIIHVDIFS